MDGVNVDFAGAKIDVSIKLIEQIGAHGLDSNRHHLPYKGSALPLSDASMCWLEVWESNPSMPD